MQGATAVDRSGAVEVVPGRLLRLGSVVELDGNISWSPPAVRGYQPVNSYLLIGDEDATLIDTGVAAHRGRLLEQLDLVLPKDKQLNVFLTRSEFDCIGNIAAIAEVHPIARLLSGGNANPFDGFDQVTGVSASWESRVKLSRGGMSEDVDLEIIVPEVRLIATFWAYDARSKALFTSDLFGHTIMSEPNGDVVIDRLEADRSTADSVRLHNSERYHWFRHARSPRPAADLRRIFGTHDIQVIAPTHGCVLKGGAVVRRHLDLLLGLLPQADEGIDDGRRTAAPEPEGGH